MPRQKTRNDDLRELEMLHLVESEGWFIHDAAMAVGLTKGAAIGARQRINKDTDKADLSPHLNGTMEPRWWDNDSE